jgi:hypothetical protein
MCKSNSKAYSQVKTTGYTLSSKAFKSLGALVQFLAVLNLSLVVEFRSSCDHVPTKWVPITLSDSCTPNLYTNTQCQHSRRNKQHLGDIWFSGGTSVLVLALRRFFLILHSPKDVVKDLPTASRIVARTRRICTVEKFAVLERS